MPSLRRSGFAASFSPSFCLLVVLLAVLWIAGGASRADVPGQVIVRGAAWAVLIIVVLMGERPALGQVRTPTIFMGLTILLPLIQLIPIPSGIWLALPGRSALAEAAAASGQIQPWRPWSIVPSATANALGSLIAPTAAFVLVTGLRDRERSWLPGLLLGVIAAGMIVGLLQFSGSGFDNPLVNATPGSVSGMFANRNHFALFLAVGCLLAPVWAFMGGRRPRWRGPTALGLALLFVLTILATGSRAGMAVGAGALVLGLLLIRHSLRRELRSAARWVFPTVVAAVVASLALLVIVSATVGRAESINRLVEIDAASDTRVRALPTVLTMIQTYFPAGTGFGSFDPMFRISEPQQLLKPTYFNHAHDDFLEVVLDGGIVGVALVAAALAWWIFAGIRMWRQEGRSRSLIPGAGWATLLLVFAASFFDYPARTPIIMTIVVIAAIWLAQGEKALGSPALPMSDRPL